MALGLKIPTKTLADNFDLQDFKDDFNTLETYAEQMKEILNTWETFKANGGTVGNTILFDGYKAYVKGSISTDYTTGEINFGATNRLGYPTAYMTAKDTVNQTNSGVRFVNRSSSSSNSPNILEPLDDLKTNIGTPNNRFLDIWLGDNSKVVNGYTKLPNGMILQWGGLQTTEINNPSTPTTTATFPITFPNECLRVTYSEHFQDDNGNVGVGGCRLWHTDSAKIMFKCWGYQTARAVTKCNVHWFAIGH